MRLIKQLAAVSATTAKEQLLKGIPYLEWKAFVYAYNPYYNYGITYTYIDMDPILEPCEAMFDLLDKLIDKTYTGNAARMRVETFAVTHGNLIKLIINKDLRCGVSATTFNKIHNGSIPQFNIQLAKEVPLAKLEYPILAQLKYDGVRIVAINDSGIVKLFTRNGKEVNLPILANTVKEIPAINFILDGEITISTGLSADRTSVSGMINSAMHGGAIDESKLRYNIFDTMSLSEWNANRCLRPYSARFAHLMDIAVMAKVGYITPAVTNEVHSAEAALELYTQAVSGGYEGLVLKHANHFYTFKRSKDWIKVKEVKTADLKCTGLLTGTGKYDGMIGALICEGEVEGKQVKVNVGSGLTDIERSMQDGAFMHQTIEVKYNMVIQDSVTGLYSLFLPRFNGIRFDK